MQPGKRFRYSVRSSSPSRKIVRSPVNRRLVIATTAFLFSCVASLVWYRGIEFLAVQRERDIQRAVSHFLGRTEGGSAVRSSEDRFGHIVSVIARHPERLGEGARLLTRIDPTWEIPFSGTSKPVWVAPPSAQIAVPVLIEAVRSNDDQRREVGIRLLGWLGPVSRSAVGPLIVESVDATDEKSRAEIIAALTDINPDWPLTLEARGAVTELVKLLAAEDEAKRGRAEDLLRSIDPGWTSSENAFAAVPWLIEHSFTGDKAFRQATEVVSRLNRLLEEMSGARDMVPQLISRIESDSREERRIACDWLARIDRSWGQSSSARRHLKAYLEKLADRRFPIHADVQQILDGFGADWPKLEEAQRAAPGFKSRVVDFDSDFAVLLSLLDRIDSGWRRDSKSTIVPALIAELDGPHAAEAARRLKSFGRDALAAKAKLIPMLAVPGSETNIAAFVALDAIDANWPESPAAASIVPALLRRKPDYSIVSGEELSGYGTVIAVLCRVGIPAGEKQSIVHQLLLVYCGSDDALSRSSLMCISDLIAIESRFVRPANISRGHTVQSVVQVLNRQEWFDPGDTIQQLQASLKVHREYMAEVRAKEQFQKLIGSGVKPTVDRLKMEWPARYKGPVESRNVSSLVRTLETLGAFGNSANVSKDELKKWLNHGDSRVRAAARQAWWNLKFGSW